MAENGRRERRARVAWGLLLGVWRGEGRRQRSSPGRSPRSTLRLEQLEPRTLLAGDLESVIQTAPAAGAPPAVMEVALEVCRVDGSPAASLQPGEPFLLKATTRDLRPDPEGVFAVYVDVSWEADRAVVTGPAEFAAPYVNAPSGTPQAGMLDEVGAFAGLSRTYGDRYELFRVPMQAIAPGELAFTLDPADDLPMHALLMYGVDDPIDPGAVRMVGARVVVEGGPMPPASTAEGTADAGPAGDAATLLLAGTLEATAAGGASAPQTLDGASTSASNEVENALLLSEPGGSASQAGQQPSLSAGNAGDATSGAGEDSEEEALSAEDLDRFFPGL